MKLIAEVDDVAILALVGGNFEVQVTHNNMAGEWIIGETPEAAIVIACERALGV